LTGLLEMKRYFQLYLIALAALLTGCNEEIEPPQSDGGLDFKPLSLGNTWVYQVDETIYFGENDVETSSFFFQDRVRSSFLNAEKELVFVVERSKSADRKVWTKQLDYTLQIRNYSLIRSTNNKSVVVLNFPPDLGKKWNGFAYQAFGKDEFEIDSVGTGTKEGKTRIELVRVRQEKLDDKVTQRDNRYEIFKRSVGLVEKYDEVLTYCSRNNCLGTQLIDGGYRVKMKLVDYAVR
jgi:hypothetical protein